MKEYLEKESAPLKFHFIYATFLLPFSAFMNLFNLVTTISTFIKSKEKVDLFFVLGILYTLLFIACCFFSQRKLVRFEKKGLYGLCGLLLLQIIDNALKIWLGLKSGDSLYIVASCLSFFYIALIAIYYYKRRKLFDGVLPMKNEEVVEEVVVPMEDNSVEEEEEEEEVILPYDCPKCGYHIENGAVFCPKCGAQTRSVR